MAKISEISNNMIDLQQIENDLKIWVPQVVEGLLFLQNVNDVRLYIIDNMASQTLFMWNNPNPVKLLFNASSTKGQEKIIKQCGNTKLVMFPMILAVHPPISMNGQKKEMEWLVQLGKGNVEDAQFDWNKIKPAGKTLPRHGIAAPINASTFKGRSFCFLPLPGETNLPVHIHGQFVLYSDRRGIWINSDDSKANCDQNIIWNLRLCEAISVAYAHFLINCIDHKEVPTAKQALLQSLNNYYKLFPNLTLCKSTPWSCLAKRTCAILSHLNPLILATVVRSNLMPITSIRNYSQVCEETFVIKWYKLHQCNTPDEPHFYLKKDKNAE